MPPEGGSSSPGRTQSYGPFRRALILVQDAVQLTFLSMAVYTLHLMPPVRLALVNARIRARFDKDIDGLDKTRSMMIMRRYYLTPAWLRYTFTQHRLWRETRELQVGEKAPSAMVYDVGGARTEKGDWPLVNLLSLAGANKLLVLNFGSCS
jgi:hypothetical protein